MALALALADPLDLKPAPRYPPHLRLTPEPFERLCQANPKAVLELTADGQLSAMTTNGGETGARNLRLGLRLLLWADGPGAGAWIAFDSSGGYRRLPDGSRSTKPTALASAGCCCPTTGLSQG